MKFGKNLSVQQAKYVGLRFLNYKDLKKMIKLNANDPQFEILLQAEIEQVNDSFSHHVIGIQGKLSELAAHMQDQSTSVSARLRRIMHLAEEVEVLRRFAVWNAVAVVKILKKRTKALAGPAPPGLGAVASSSVFPPPSCPTETWLSKQLFFSGSDFAELQAGLESLAEELTRERLFELSGRLPPQLQSAASHQSTPSQQPMERCPICLEECVDAVELSTCGHRICWKCCVLGPIAFAPGEYRLSRCSVCRNEQPLDPTKNFKTVCSNKLNLLSQLVEDSIDSAPNQEMVWDGGLDVLYGTARGKNKIESEKERQTIESIDGACPSSTFFCSLCCEPLLLEAVSTTPCKHFFHRVCLEKYAACTCPLCDEPLPIHLVTPRYVYEQLRRLNVTTPGWTPANPCGDHKSAHSDAPCSNCGQYTLHNLPPATLVGSGGLEMASYIHLAPVQPLAEEPANGSEDRTPVYYSRFGEIRGFSQSVIEDMRRRSEINLT
jgi:hypothetical protein